MTPGAARRLRINGGPRRRTSYVMLHHATHGLFLYYIYVYFILFPIEALHCKAFASAMSSLSHLFQESLRTSATRADVPSAVWMGRQKAAIPRARWAVGKAHGHRGHWLVAGAVACLLADKARSSVALAKGHRLPVSSMGRRLGEAQPVGLPHSRWPPAALAMALGPGGCTAQLWAAPVNGSPRAATCFAQALATCCGAAPAAHPCQASQWSSQARPVAPFRRLPRILPIPRRHSPPFDLRRRRGSAPLQSRYTYRHS